MNIVWLKRDLRDDDHEPLFLAAEVGLPFFALLIIEPEWFSSPEFDQQHLRFLGESIADLEPRLEARGIPLILKHGNALQTFRTIHDLHPIVTVFSHEETGLQWTFHRDKEVKKFFRASGIQWQEYRQFGVVRGLKDRDRWAALREKIIRRPLFKVTGQARPGNLPPSDPFPYHLLSTVDPRVGRQKGGRTLAMETLDSFLSERGEEYSFRMSSPLTASHSCSRISPYLSWGNLSIREVHEKVRKRLTGAPEREIGLNNQWKRSLNSFESRLWWHCHFIQKLESEPDIEFYNFNRAFDGMREAEFDEEKSEAWCKGETGVPFIDACMRSLLKTGWINFRMRAMLMSFSSYQLWLHWKKPAEFLARQFLDFEPGIHYAQAQMQSGVTGINTIRIYSPKKQMMEHDPCARFVKEHLTELSKLPSVDCLEPHRTPPLLALSYGFAPGLNYPLPIVDPELAYKRAKERIFTYLKKREVREKSAQVLKDHGSRKGRFFPAQKRS